nr:hypothetical protein [Ardenticatena sp.]
MIFVERLIVFLVIGAFSILFLVWILNQMQQEEGNTQLLSPSQLRERLRQAINRRHADDVRHLLETTLPTWPLRAALIEACDELLALINATHLAADAGVPTALIERAQREAYRALESVVELAVRTRTVAAQHVRYTDIRETAEQEAAELRELAHAAATARAALARLTLTEGRSNQDTLRQAEQELRLLETTARALSGDFGE